MRRNMQTDKKKVFVQAEIEASETIKMYMKKTGRKTIKWIKKLCDAMKAKKILLYMPILLYPLVPATWFKVYSNSSVR